MNWKRAAKKAFVPFYNTKDLITKVKDYGVVEGVKEKMKEDWLEDTPVVSNIYNMGKSEGEYIGKKEGYTRASNVFEQKLINLGNQFLKEKNTMEVKLEEMDELLNDYEACIEELEREKEALSADQKNLLVELLNLRDKLITLKGEQTKRMTPSKIVSCPHCSKNNRINIVKVNEDNFRNVKCGSCKGHLFTSFADL
jgi:seryl-tRNA synthetase